jgi:peptidoglycan hydrolase FlgJ
MKIDKSSVSNSLDSNPLGKIDLNSPQGKKIAQKIKAAEEVAGQFETVFVNMMLKSMRETAKPEEESNAMGIYGGMLDDEYGKSMSQGHNFGIKKAIFDWIQQNDPDIKSNSKDFQKAIKGYQQNQL